MIAFFSLDAQFAIASTDTTISIWNTSSLVKLYTLTNHSSPVNSLIFITKYSYLASASSDGSILIWQIYNTTNPILINRLFYQNAINCLLDLQNDNIASGSDDNIITIWNIFSGLITGTLIGHTQPIVSLAYLSFDQIASGSHINDSSIIIWNITSYQLIGSPLSGHTDTVYSLIVFPNGYLASSGGHNDPTIRIWNTTSQTQIGVPLTGHNDSIRALVLLPNGLLCSGSEDSTIRIWNSNFFIDLELSASYISIWV